MNPTAAVNKELKRNSVRGRSRTAAFFLREATRRHTHEFVARRRHARLAPVFSFFHDPPCPCSFEIFRSPSAQPADRYSRGYRGESPGRFKFSRERDAALTRRSDRRVPSHDHHGVSRSSSRPARLLRVCVHVRRRCVSGGDGARRGLAVRARGGADAAEGPPRRAEVLHRRLEHQQRALLGLGRLQRGAGLRGGRSLVRRVRRRPVPRRVLLLLLPQPQHLLLPRGPGRLAPAPPRLHGRHRHRVRRPVRRAGPVPRQHGGDGGLRGEAVGGHGGQPADLLRVPGGGEGGRRGTRLAARRRQGEDRRRRAQGELRLRRARRPHRQQLRQDPRRAGHNKEDPNCSCSWDANPRLRWSCVVGVWIGVAGLRVGVPRLDSGCGNVCDVRHFPPPAQRGGGHVRGDGRVGAPPAGAHGAGRHPAVRGHGGRHGGARPEQGGELPPRGRAQRRHLQRVQPRLPAAGAALAAALLQPVGSPPPAALQPLHAGPPRPRLRARRGRRPGRRAAGVGRPGVPDGGRWRVGGVRHRRARDAVHARADARRRQRELRAVPLRAGAGGPGRLRVRAPRVPGRRRGPLPRAAEVQRAGVPGPAGRRGRRAALGAAVGRALEGEAEEERLQGDGAHGAAAAAALQVPAGGEGAAAQPEKKAVLHVM